MVAAHIPDQCDITFDQLSDFAQSGLWHAYGCVLVRGALPIPTVRRVVAEFTAEVLPSDEAFPRQPHFRRESGSEKFPHAYHAPNDVSETREGRLLLNGIKDPHVLTSHPGFAGLSLSALTHPRLQEVYAGLDVNHPRYILQQSMFFDANPQTVAHQDSFYIDSDPRGFLIGAWLALETIAPDVGFWVAPQSHKTAPNPVEFGTDNAAYLDAFETFMASHADDFWAPAMEAGDILIWHGNVVHGSHRTDGPPQSRKALTAHYVPETMRSRGTHRIRDNTQEQVAAKMRYVVNTKPSVEGRTIETVQHAMVPVGQEQIDFIRLRTRDGTAEVFRMDAAGADKLCRTLRKI